MFHKNDNQSLNTDTFKTMFEEFKEIREPDKIPFEKISPEKTEPSNKFSEFENFKCPYCQESTLVADEGSYVCTNSGCGKENGIVISEKQEWRSFADSYDNKDSSRCGMATHPLLPQSSLGTVAQGNIKYGYAILQIQNAMPTHERPRFTAITLIKKAAKKLLIPGILADNACYLYVRLTENIKVKKGFVRKALMANCQYAICKRKGRNFYICSEKLSEAFEITVKKFNEGSKLFEDLSFYKTNCNDLNNIWDKKLITSRLSFVKPTEPENIIRNACDKLPFSDIDIGSIIFITRNVKKLGIISSKMPQSIAAGCILLHVKKNDMKNIKLNKISNFCTVSDTTATNTYNELKIYINYIIPHNTNDLISGEFGNCMPEKQLSKIYTAPKGSFPSSLIINSNSNKINVCRGRPKKKPEQKSKKDF